MKRLIVLIFFYVVVIKGVAQPILITVSPITFSTSITITFTVPTTNTVTLIALKYISTYSVDPHPVHTFINDSLMNAGTYTINYTPVGWDTGYYFISLGLIYSNGSGSGSPVKIHYQEATTGINQIKTNALPFIYPNPANKYITINYDGFKKINVVDLTGRIIKSVSTTDNKIPVSDINTGEYIINVYSEEDKLLITDKLYKTE